MPRIALRTASSAVCTMRLMLTAVDGYADSIFPAPLFGRSSLAKLVVKLGERSQSQLAPAFHSHSHFSDVTRASFTDPTAAIRR